MTQSEMSKLEMLASVGLLHGGEEAPKLFSFLSPEKERHVSQISQSLEPSDLQRRLHLRRFSVLQEIHPGWILERLEGESPRVLGVLCRFLTGDKVRYLVEHLSASEQLRLPSLKDTYRISSALVELVRECVEKKWPLDSVSRLNEAFSFPHIVWMKSNDLKILFQELGLGEIQRAFSEISSEMRKAFLTRFSMREAQLVRKRMEGKYFVPRLERQEAQQHLLTLPLDDISVEIIFDFVGYSVFAQALGPNDRLWSELVYQKLPPVEGHRLKRLIQETPLFQKTASEDILKKRQERILGRVESLVAQGLIQHYWKQASTSLPTSLQGAL